MGKTTSQHTGEVYRPYTREGVSLYPLVDENSRQVKLSVIRGDSIHYQWFSIGTVIGVDRSKRPSAY